MGFYSVNRNLDFSNIDLRVLSRDLTSLARKLEGRCEIENILGNVDHDIRSGSLRPNERTNAIHYFEKMSRELDYLNRDISDIENAIIRNVGDHNCAGDVSKYFLEHGMLPKDFVESVEDSRRMSYGVNNNWNGRVNAARTAFGNFNPRSTGRDDRYASSNQQYASLINNANQTYRDRFNKNNEESDYIPIYSGDDVKEIVSENLRKSQKELPKDELFSGGDDLQEFKTNYNQQKVVSEVRKNAEEENLIILKKGKEMNKQKEKIINLLPYRVLIQKEGMNPVALEKMTLDTVYDKIVSVDKAKFNFRYESDVNEHTTLNKENFEKYGLIDSRNIEVINFIAKDKFSKVNLCDMNKCLSTIHINTDNSDGKINPSALNAGELAYLSTVLSRCVDSNEYYDKDGKKFHLEFQEYSADKGRGILGLHIPTQVKAIAISPSDYDILPTREDKPQEQTKKLEEFLEKLALSISKSMNKLSTSKDLYTLFVEFNRLLVERRPTANDVMIPREILSSIQNRVIMALNDVVSKSCLTDVDFFENFDETRIDYIMEKVSMICLYIKHRVSEKDIENYIRSSIIKPLYQIVSSLSIEKMVNTVNSGDVEYKNLRYKLSYNLTEQNVLILTAKEILPELHSWYVSNESNVIITKDSFPFLYNVINAAQRKMRELEIKDDDIVNSSMVGYRLTVSMSSHATGECVTFTAHPTICDCDNDVLYVLSAVK